MDRRTFVKSAAALAVIPATPASGLPSVDLAARARAVIQADRYALSEAAATTIMAIAAGVGLSYEQIVQDYIATTYKSGLL
jgi:hypothetical protein